MKTNIKIARVEIIPINKIKFIKGNRNTYESHIQKMYDLIDTNGFADTIKVIPKEDYYCAVEGQHRVSALKLHGVKEVPCSIIDWLGEDVEEIQRFIISLNAHNKTWDLIDSIKSWADLKKENYGYLLDKVKNYNNVLSVGSIVSCFDGIRRQHNSVKKGKLKILDKDFSETLLEAMKNFVVSNGKKKANSKITYCAAELIYNSGDDIRYKVLQAFLLAANTHLNTTEEPLPDGDKAFDYWFEEVVMKTYYPIIKQNMI
jgi:hypothetical protein